MTTCTEMETFTIQINVDFTHFPYLSQYVEDFSFN